MTSPSDAPILSSISIDAVVDEIAKVSIWMAELEERDDWPTPLRFGLELSVEEALANVITHAFEDVESDPVIRVDYFRPAPDSVGMRILDNGPPFDPTAVESASLAESVESAHIGGHGVRLMRHFLSHIGYVRRDGMNELTLVAGPKSAD
ncbi:ATP-binding protein [Aquabacter cavernae]|uniref:ATP-binding protein n=1 Tax=Aquabacter cavernae TaxID=2496029 RepID=UPI000F8EB487|nr:ATP-binding protein [Aquabacter cavernae]